MRIKQSVKYLLYRSRLKGLRVVQATMRQCAFFVLFFVRISLRLGLYVPARFLLKLVGNRLGDSRHARWAIKRAFENRPLSAGLSNLRGRELGNQIIDALLRNDVAKAITTATQFDKIRSGMPTEAGTALARRILNAPNSRLMRQSFRSGPVNGALADALVKELNQQAIEAVTQKSLGKSLKIAAQFEFLERQMPTMVGKLLARQIESERGRVKVRRALKTARAGYPRSQYLIHLIGLTLAMEGKYQDAGRIVQAELKYLSRQSATTDAEKLAARRGFDKLRGTWAIINRISREDTGWVDPEAGKGTNESVPNSQVDSTTPDDLEDTSEPTLVFKEPLLEGRDGDAYLAACMDEFRQSTTLLERLRVTTEMLNEGTRRQLRYHPAYAQANTCYDTIKPELFALFDVQDTMGLMGSGASLIVRSCVNAMALLRQLGRTDELEALKEALEIFARRCLTTSIIWLVLPALVQENLEKWQPRAEALRQLVPELPVNEGQLRSYLRWLLLTRKFAEADTIFSTVPKSLRSASVVLLYSNILQRQCRFAQAIAVLRTAHTLFLSRPHQMNTAQHWTLLQRLGMFDFLQKNAEAFEQVPQPSAPDGVVILAARNLDQLRKYPLVVLLELRRQNWAVVSLVEGLLPFAPTGNPDIDILQGCLTIERSLSFAAQNTFLPLNDFVANPAAGRLDWKGLKLNHSLLEDARISRRSYDVDFTCPALIDSLQKLCDWTALQAQAMEHARRSLSAQGVRCGWMTLFNARLPDSLFRLYCEEFGDPETFFALQVANGYENYFSNFGNKISTRCVIRNVTKFNDVRSASFPQPVLFDQFVQANSRRSEEVLNRVEHIATAKRFAQTVGPADPAAAECETAMMAHRAAGGHVVCLFGRVVCDSAVPFDGGPVHTDLRDWLNHSIAAVRDSNTLLVIKPHPHEVNEQIATYLNQYFIDLIAPENMVDGKLPPNVIVLGHKWFDIAAMAKFVDLGLIYNGTVAIEMALLNIPCIQCNHFGPIDYPLGHLSPTSRAEYEDMLTFRISPKGAPDMRARAAFWLDYMSNGRFAMDYRYHSRPVTNKVVYPPWWVEDDLETYLTSGDANVQTLAGRVIGANLEPAE